METTEISDLETFTHLLKVTLGTGILSMPAAFKASGLVAGIILTVVISWICTYCSYILVESAHEIYERVDKNKLSFAEVTQEAFLQGPQWARKWAPLAKQMVLVLILITYFMMGSCYCVILASTLDYSFHYFLGYDVNLKLIIGMLLVPVVLLIYVPHLKHMAIVSTIANILMGLTLTITMYYLVTDLPSISDRNWVSTDLKTYPTYFSITIFALEFVGVIMPLENQMKNPKHFTGILGVLNRGMILVTVIHILIGFLGYYKYGDGVKGSITLNLPVDSYAAQAVNIFVFLAIFGTLGVQFYVCIDVAWNAIKLRYEKQHTFLVEYTLRTILMVSAVATAAAVPTIIPFVGLVGAFCFSLLGIVLPVILRMLIYWDMGYGRFHWILIKDIMIITVGLSAMVFGSSRCMQDILKLYM